MPAILEPQRICASDDPEWLNYRMRGISASEAAAACGVSEWQSPLELYYRKRGQLPPLEENRAMRLGRKLEPIIADEFEAETGLKLAERQPGLYRHAEWDWILATPDAVISADALAEFKAIGERRAQEVLGEQGTDEVPYEWNTQAQQQMLVMGAREVYFGVLVGGSDFRVYLVQRHEGALEKIVHRVNKLWEQIVTGNPPEWTENRYNLQLARNLFRTVEPGSIITLSESSAQLWQEYEECGKTMKETEWRRDEAKARILMELENHEAGRLPDGRCVRRKVITKSEYVVKASSYVDVRAVSAKSYE